MQKMEFPCKISFKSAFQTQQCVAVAMQHTLYLLGLLHGLSRRLKGLGYHKKLTTFKEETSSLAITFESLEVMVHVCHIFLNKILPL